MTKRTTKTTQGSQDENESSSTPSAIVSKTSEPTLSAKAKTGSEFIPRPSLVICRNKHWRYISSYHGPWLNLPPEVLESLAVNNFYSPRPRPIDPAVFFDLVKIRRLIDDATSLTIRAANGTTSASLNTALNSTNGMLNGADAEILGIGSSRGSNAKLSKERKYRMREHATQKLSHAYRLDEIAASVATMQSASSLEEVAKLVLQRNEREADAQYVHFFHEKIPSKSLAASTSLHPLDDIILQKPSEPSIYRTRAVTRLFKDDFEGAIRDLTESLALHRLYHAQHQNGQTDVVLAKDIPKSRRDYRNEAKIDEKDQPSSLEPQLLFHRGGAYLSMACDQISVVLPWRPRKPSLAVSSSQANGTDHPSIMSAEKDEAKVISEARKLVRTYAKRALRDYTAFLSHFEYTPGLSADQTESFLQRVSILRKSQGNRARGERPPESDHQAYPGLSKTLARFDSESSSGLSEALVHHEEQQFVQSNDELPPISKPKVHKLNTLFAALPPADLPEYPPDLATAKESGHPSFSLPEFSEAVTYHPLLTDVLHSLLLCHCLIQTSPKEHLRHAYMAARLARLCDGYPIFLAARSPARADWIEVVRRSSNWLGLESDWETLCAPAPLTSQKDKKQETVDEKKERIKRQAIREALADEKVIHEETNAVIAKRQNSLVMREGRNQQRRNGDVANDPDSNPNGNGHAAQPKRWAQDDSKEYPITSGRAEIVARWILEIQPPSFGDGSGKAKKKSAGKDRLKKMASSSSSLRGLEQSVESLDLVD